MATDFYGALYESRYLRLKEGTPSRDAFFKAVNASAKLVPVTISLGKGDVLVRAGDPLSRAYLVTDRGTLSCRVDGKQVYDLDASSGLFAVNALDDPGASSDVDVVATSAVKLSFVTRSGFQSALTGLVFTSKGRFVGRNVYARSVRRTNLLDADVSEFKGIEYATASRYCDPVGVEYASGRRVGCLRKGPSAPQPAGMIADLAPAPAKSNPSKLTFVAQGRERVGSDGLPHGQSERCLYLNVTAPAGDDHAPLPVMVWIHGGAFVTGGGGEPQYEGRVLSSRGVVVVSINYRLNAFGFLSFPEIGLPTNLGLKDQIEALRWVQKNVADFGGDPSNVTVFGESAGGMSIGCLMGSQIRRDERLFTKAIPQSGASHAVLTSAQARVTTDLFVSAAGLVGIEDLEELSDALRNRLTAAEVLEAAAKVVEGRAKLPTESSDAHVFAYLRGIALPFQPVAYSNGPFSIDPVFTCVPPLVSISRGMASDVALMTGAMNTEYRFFMLAGSPWKRFLEKPQEDYLAYLANKLETFVRGDPRFHPVDDLTQRCRRIVALLSDTGIDDDQNESYALMFERLHSLWLFLLPAHHLLSISSLRRKDVYCYRVDYETSLMNLHAAHALDIPLVFGTYDTSPLGSLLTDKKVVEQASREMRDAWVSFARTGDPGFRAYAPHERGVYVFGSDPETGVGAFDASGQGLFKGSSASYGNLVHELAALLNHAALEPEVVSTLTKGNVAHL